jgi:nicotinamide-nucleotide amidase
VLGLQLVEDPELLRQIQGRFERRGLRMPDANRQQAAVPRGATVFAKSKRDGARSVDDANDRVWVLLPGPPREMQPMFEQSVKPRSPHERDRVVCTGAS